MGPAEYRKVTVIMITMIISNKDYDCIDIIIVIAIIILIIVITIVMFMIINNDNNDK